MEAFSVLFDILLGLGAPHDLGKLEGTDTSKPSLTHQTLGKESGDIFSLYTISSDPS